jgi:hypothetical protein
VLEEAVIEIGQVTHFFSKINVAVVELTLSLSVGDRILIKGPSTDFNQTVTSIQIDHEEIQRAESRQSVGLKSCSRHGKKTLSTRDSKHSLHLSYISRFDML